MTATWWQNWISTKRIWYVKQLLSLLYGSVSYCFTVYFCLASNPVPGLGIVDFIGFLRNPIVVFLNIITLIATLYHTATYFVMTPKVMNIIVKMNVYHITC